MRKLTEEKLQSILKHKRMWKTIRERYEKCALCYTVDPDIVASIFIIETFFRPFYMRFCEYCLLLVSAMNCLIFKHPIKNYTIGCCQVGLSTILNYYGIQTYQHAHTVMLSGFADLRLMYSVISKKKSVEILTFRLAPIIQRANRIYPNKLKSRLNYIGTQYNGRFAYGMLFTWVYQQERMTIKQ
jgi:hypothetical protein